MWSLVRRLAPLLLVLGVACSSSGASGRFEGLAVDDPATMPALVLRDTEGNAFDLVADTESQIRLVYFGYTNCPDICPIHLSQLRDVLGRAGMPGNVAVIFVTVDPERDTPEVIRDYLDQFDADFIGLTGTEEELIAAQRAFGSIDKQDHSVNHH